MRLVSDADFEPFFGVRAVEVRAPLNASEGGGSEFSTFEAPGSESSDSEAGSR